jgi:hypothetical protein
MSFIRHFHYFLGMYFKIFGCYLLINITSVMLNPVLGVISQVITVLYFAGFRMHQWEQEMNLFVKLDRYNRMF